MSEKLFSLVSGIIFGVGLVISGMTNPGKVIGFLSIAHNWDASLIFVMGGAIFITAPFFYILKDRNKSSLGVNIKLPQKKDLIILVLKNPLHNFFKHSIVKYYF